MPLSLARRLSEVSDWSVLPLSPKTLLMEELMELMAWFLSVRVILSE